MKIGGSPQSTAGETAQMLTRKYGKEVVVASFKGYPIVIFKDKIEDENGYPKAISNYP